MGDKEVDFGSLAAACGINSRSSNRPVHGWLCRAEGQDEWSFVPVRK